jgi:PPK2 family polyphosphate:nucleotide phosphotransferase
MTSIDHTDFRVKPNHEVHLADFDPGSTGEFKSKNNAQAKLRADIERLSVLQDMLYAKGDYALLLILQGMDAAGKDGTIKHVMTGVNPQGVAVSSFKTPSAEELAHDYLWRCAKVLPERGQIGIFNRSYYEELVVVRVHEDILEHERLPLETETNVWKDRYEDILAFERHLSRNGTLIVKCFLHISKDEQRKRLLERIDTPDKNWKLSVADVHERKFWDRYQHAYEQLLTHTSAKVAPWYVIPADHKWYARIAVANIILAELEALHLTYPQINDEQRADLAAVREMLGKQDD